jgi:predicted TIM-barrel enzyme
MMTTATEAQSAITLFHTTPLVISALHLPDLAVARGTPMAQLEDYVLANAAVFAEAGVPALMLQDATREVSPASPETLAIMGSLGRLLRAEFPQLQLGIIIQAHDPRAALAVAHAVGAGFVRIKVFVGGVMAADGPRDGLATMARAYRHHPGREDIGILADVHDRTSYPRTDVPHEQAALWAQQLGANGLILTGATFDESLDRIRRARAAGVRVPILIGGSVTEANVGAAFEHADGVIVSTSLMKKDVAAGQGVRWDVAAARRFMEAAMSAMGARAPR